MLTFRCGIEQSAVGTENKRMQITDFLPEWFYLLWLKQLPSVERENLNGLIFL